MIASSSQTGPFGRVLQHIPSKQFGRYVLVGAWNSAFGYAAYATLTALLTPRLPYAYVMASVLASALNITVAFLGYKWLIFKTKGNYLREWIRCLAVTSGGIALSILLLPIFVYTLRHAIKLDASAPYIAGAMMMGVNAFPGFLGHKKFTFAESTPRQP